jgi:hypothetical protein
VAGCYLAKKVPVPSIFYLRVAGLYLDSDHSSCPQKQLQKEDILVK